MREVADVVCSELGTRPPRFDVPAWVLAPVGVLVEWSSVRRGVEPLITPYAARTLCNDVQINSDKAIRELGLRPGDALEAFAETTRWLRDNDLLAGPPRTVVAGHRAHPVAWFGRSVLRAEKTMYADSGAAGAGLVATTTLPWVVLAAFADRAAGRHRVTAVLLTAVVTWTVVGSASLIREGQAMAGELQGGAGPQDAHPGGAQPPEAALLRARARLPNLCGRAADGLDAGQLSRATVESLAENTCDAVIAPLFWGVVGGVPGLVAHRAVNTLDAMIGHRDQRYRRFGTAAARLDDAMAWAPARLTAVLCCVAAGRRAPAAWRAVRRDHGAHPSPNGGWCEAAWAGALGVRLGGRNTYPGGRVEHRGYLGDGRDPAPGDIRPAARLVRAVTVLGTVAAVGCVLARPARRGVGTWAAS
ncbi:MAG: cobalamin biosynthesis protein [Micrococcales bacterium]|nr:MAG: cobalamin biosynthesis protein [Micrococcales bacterium]